MPPAGASHCLCWASCIYVVKMRRPTLGIQIDTMLAHLQRLPLLCLSRLYAFPDGLAPFSRYCRVPETGGTSTSFGNRVRWGEAGADSTSCSYSTNNMTCRLGLSTMLCALQPIESMLCAVMGARRSVAACAACALLLLVAVSADQTATQGASQPSTTLTTMAQQGRTVQWEHGVHADGTRSSSICTSVGHTVPAQAQVSASRGGSSSFSSKLTCLAANPI